MTSIALDIANAVADLLSAATFEMEFEAEAAAVPRWELKDLKVLRVTCVPVSVSLTNATRGSTQYAARIDIGVQKRLGSAVEADVAGLCALTEEIARYIRNRPLPGVTGVNWAESLIDPLFSLAHLDEHRTFTSVISVTYKGILA
ncbi:MAG TPA: hypothetical protein VM492_01985 [Sumerlaeia bacterium]|nr:hypothetical protein [Sumerlaeia bacterium]